MNRRNIRRSLSCIMAAAFLMTVLAGCFSSLAQPSSQDNIKGYYQRIDDAPLNYENVIKRFGMTLAVDKNNAAIRLTDAYGTNWDSTPADFESDELANAAAKMAMASLIKVSYADITGNITTVNCYTASVNKGTYTISEIDDGIRFVFVFEREGFEIPVELQLTQDGLSALVPVSQIKETNDSFKLTRVTLMPHFGAANTSENGYLLVPDGSGALIDFEAADPTAEPYEQYVYGRDFAVNKLKADNVTQNALLPVFGCKRGDSAFLGVITSGAPRAVINAEAGGNTSSYFNIAASFIYRDTDMVLVEKKNQTVRILERGHSSAKQHSVLYRFLNGSSANYGGMAESYRNYLEKEHGLKPENGKDGLYLSLLGGVKATVNVMGFPTKRVRPLTDYQGAVRLLENLLEKGVDGLSVRYVGWNKNSDKSAIQNKIIPEPNLGGKKGFLSLVQYCKQNDIALYPDINVTDIVKGNMSYNKRNAAKSIQRNPAMQYRYLLNDGNALVTMPTFLVAPRMIRSLTEKISSSADKWGLPSLSASTFGNKIYSDFGSNKLSRDQSEQLWQDSLSELRRGDKGLLLSAACGYSIPFASAITDTPMSSSGFSVETHSIPFYQMVLRGVIPLATTPINFAGNSDKALLFAAESGISPSFSLLEKNQKYLKDSAHYEHITNGLIEDWADKAAAAYLKLSPLLKAVSNQTIKTHQIINEGVRKTVFSNGITVIVNYTENAISLDGVTIEALNFVWEE